MLYVQWRSTSVFARGCVRSALVVVFVAIVLALFALWAPGIAAILIARHGARLFAGVAFGLGIGLGMGFEFAAECLRLGCIVGLSRHRPLVVVAVSAGLLVDGH